MKRDVMIVVIASALYTAILHFFGVGGGMSPAAYGVAFVGGLGLGAIALITTRALRRDLRDLGGESA